MTICLKNFESRQFISALLLIKLFSSIDLVAQLEFDLNNRFVDAPVFDAQGLKLDGPNYSAELWGGATPNSLSPLVDVDSHLRVIIPFLSGAGAGFFDNSPSNKTPSAWTFPLVLQVRAWDNRLGATYEDVASKGIGGYGESPFFIAQPGDQNAGAPTIPGPLLGLQSFSLRPVVPEPSPYALLLLAVPLLVFTRRDRRGVVGSMHAKRPRESSCKMRSRGLWLVNIQ